MARKEKNIGEDRQKTEDLAQRHTSVTEPAPEAGSHDGKEPEDDEEVNEAEVEMSFWGHLEALRWVLIRVAVVLVILVIAAFIAMPHVFDTFILGPTTSNFFLYRFFAHFGGKIPFLPDFGDQDFSVSIININVASQFMTHISTSFWLALVLVFPYLIYEIWKFIRPALFPKEVSSMRMAFVMGTGMFYLGCAVGYCIVFPFTFRLPQFIYRDLHHDDFHHGGRLRTASAFLDSVQARAGAQGDAQEVPQICRGGAACPCGGHHPDRGSVHAFTRIHPALSPL